MWAQSMYDQVHRSIWLSGGVGGGLMACQEVLVITSTTQPAQVLGESIMVWSPTWSDIQVLGMYV